MKVGLIIVPRRIGRIHLLRQVQKDKIIDYAKATHELFQYGSDITILFHDAHVEVPEKFSWIVTDCLKKCIKPLNNSIYEKWCEFYESDKGKISIWPLVPPKDIFQKDNLKVVKRKAILSFLYLVNNHKENAGNKFIKIGLDMDYVNKTNSYRQEHYWQRQVNTIDHFIQSTKFWRMIYDGTLSSIVISSPWIRTFGKARKTVRYCSLRKKVTP